MIAGFQEAGLVIVRQCGHLRQQVFIGRVMAAGEQVYGY